MNIVAALSGSIKALMGREDWVDHFDLTRKGLQQSFIASSSPFRLFILLPMPFRWSGGTRETFRGGYRCRSARTFRHYFAPLSAVLLRRGVYLHHDF